ncbi:MAG: site-specific integrase [Bacteroidetes bacterium]|nr:site-specific integrase [Bacteroidota bacterium]
MAKVNFYLKDKKAKTETLVYLFFSYNNERLKYSTGEKIHPKNWNFDNQRVKKSFSGSLEMNNLFDRIGEGVQKIHRVAITENHNLTNEYLKGKLDKQINPDRNLPKDFFDFLSEFIEVNKVSKTHRTIQKYKTLENHLKDFQTKKNFKLSFEKIDARFYEQLTAYFIGDLKLLNNSSAKYIKTLKTFLHWATERGYNANLSFVKFKAQERDADIIYLTEEELLRLYNFDLSKKTAQENVRDVFCFGCFTGLRYSDIIRVKKEHIKGDELHFISEKTTDRLIIPLSNYAKAILKKHKYSLPVVSNQKTNEHLKEIGKLEGIEIDEPIVLTKFRGVEEIQIRKPKHEFLSSHTARRTFVTLSLEKGMRPETVMSITGHKEYATFKKYIKITSKVKLVEMKRIWNRPQLKAVS